MNEPKKTQSPALLPAVLLGSVLLIAAVGPATGSDARLLPAQPGDLAAGALGGAELVSLVEAPEKGMIPGTPREAVRFAFPLAADQKIETAVRPFEAQSREYFVDVDAAALRDGVDVFTTAPGALVRLNPAALHQGVAKRARAMAIDPAGIVISNGERRFDAAASMALLADGDQLKAAGAPFAEGTVAFRLAPGVGSGTLRLAVPGLEAAGLYTLHVFDRGSDLSLDLAASAADLFHGETLGVRAAMKGAEIESVEGFVTSPAGRAWPLDLRAADAGELAARLPVDAVASMADGPRQGLWEVHVAVRARVGTQTVMRSARTSFAVHLPTAGLTGDVAVERGRRGLELGFGVDVGAPGRYEVRGVVFGTDRATGELRPMAAVHAADWLEAAGTLTLEVDGSLLGESGLRAPFELRDLRLLDQGRMGVLHRQAVALRIGLGK